MFESLKKVYKLFPKKDHYKIFILFGMMLVASVFELLGIGIVPAFVVAVSDPDRIMKYPVIGDWLKTAGITGTKSLVIFGAILLILIYIFKNVYIGFFIYVKRRFVANRGVYLQNRLFRDYMTAPYAFYINRNSAELLRNVVGEVNLITEKIIVPFLELSLNGIMFLFIIGGLFIFEPLITLSAIIVLGGGGFIFLRYTHIKTKEFGRKDQQARMEKNKAVIQGLGGFKITRILNREKVFLNIYRRFAEISKRANIYKIVVNNMIKPIIETLSVIGILMIALIMIEQGRAVHDIIPILALFGVAAVRLMPILNKVVSQTNELRYNYHSANTVYEDLQLLEYNYEIIPEKKLDNQNITELKHNISLRNISFQYPNSTENALQDVSLSISKGSAVAFVGPTGAGKTTLVDIILGLLEPQMGQIEVDGVNIYNDTRSWQKNVGYIPQSIYLLDDSIRHNIAFGIPEKEIDESKLQDAIKAAQLKDLIERLPKGEETVVGERGVRLSGGQQQRISIARALYNNPQVLVMDEATSSLDNLTEKFVIEAIEHLRGDRTIIMIAHRLTTVRNCDVIYIIKDGKLIEKGNYTELLKHSQEFRKMSMME